MKNSKFSLKRLLFVLASLAVCSGVGAEPVTVTDPYDSEWCFVIASEGAGTIKTSIDNGTFKFQDYVDRNGTRITGQLNQDDITALASLTYPANYPTYLDLKAVTFSGEVTLTLNSLFKGLRLPQNSDFSIVPQSVDFAYYSDYTKINYNDGHNESIPIYLYVNEGGMASAISKLGDYLAYRTIYLSGSFTDSEKESLVNAKNGITIGNSGGSSGGGEGGESGGGGDTPVDQTTLAYKIANKMQLSDAPTIYIDLPDIGDNTLGTYLYKRSGQGVAADDAPYRRASMKVVATSDVTSPHYLESFEVDADHLEIKVRGNSTALEGGNNTEGKRAYRLKFAKKDKTTGIDYKHDLINGGYSKRNWVLLANVMDHSMLRNAITCELGKIVGMPFNPGYKFVDLVINGDYRGTYQVSDHPEVDSKRININEDTGWYVEFQGQKRMCDYPMFIETPYLMNVKNPEPTADEETEPELYETQRNDILNAVSAWFGPNGWQKGFGSAFTDPKTGWRAYNDEETLMKWWIVTEITGDYDGMMTVKAYREEDGKLHWGPVWDKDLAYGNYDNSNLGVPNGSLVMNCTNSTSYMKEIFSKFAADPSFIKKVKNEMDRLVNEGLKSNLCAKVDDLAIIIAPTEALNKTKWGYDSPQAGITEQYHGGVAGYDNYQAYVNQLKEWINGRVDYVQEQLTALSNAANTATEFEYDVKTVSSDAITAKMGKLVNATMKNRSFTANVWNTISLPFSVTESQLTSIFGTGYVLKEFSGVDGTNMLFTTPEGNTITGGVPYLIKPTQNVSGDIVFENVIVIANAKGWVNNFEYGAEPVCFGNYEFIGNLANTDNAWDRKKINNDLTLTDPNGDGSASQAFIRILNNAAEPTITFPEAVEPVVRTQLADVPTIYIDTQDGAAIQPSTGEYVPAAIEVLDKNNMIGGGFTETSSYLEVRGRGKTEWAVEDGKKSYRLKFAKDEKDADGNVTTSHKHDLTNGGYTKRNWILLANAADESLVRNALADELGKAMGFAFTPKYQHVDLYINNVYQGTYLATDHVEADAENGESKRVPVDEKQGWLLDMTNQDGIATGDVYVEGGESYPYINIKNPEPGNKTGTEEEIRAKVKKFFDELWAASDGTGIDKASFINWYIATEILGNANALTGIYAYKNDTDAELKFGPLWGNELALGNSAAIDMSDLTISASYTGMVYQSGTESAWKTKLQELWTKNWFKNAVKTRWAELYKSGVNDLKATMLTKYAALKTAVGQSHDGAKDDEITEIQNYLSQRFEYLDAKFAELTQTTALIGDVNGDGSVNVTDIMAIAQHILGKTPAGFDTVAADVDENGSINVNDIMKLVTIILEKE